MKYKVRISKKSKKYLDKLNQDIQDQILSKISQTVNWFNGNSNYLPDVKSLLGEWKGYYRLRVSKYRIIFRIDTDIEILFIEEINKRGDIY